MFTKFLGNTYNLVLRKVENLGLQNDSFLFPNKNFLCLKFSHSIPPPVY